ncbi:hypothetical protein ES702_04035 [subsurface metagenome]
MYCRPSLIRDKLVVKGAVWVYCFLCVILLVSASQVSAESLASGRILSLEEMESLLGQGCEEYCKDGAAECPDVSCTNLEPSGSWSANGWEYPMCASGGLLSCEDDDMVICGQAKVYEESDCQGDYETSWVKAVGCLGEA